MPKNTVTERLERLESDHELEHKVDQIQETLEYLSEAVRVLLWHHDMVDPLTGEPVNLQGRTYYRADGTKHTYGTPLLLRAWWPVRRALRHIFLYR